MTEIINDEELNANIIANDLQPNTSSPIIDSQGNAGAAPKTGAEDAAGYQAIIEQQQAQIDALIARNESLTGQFARLIANGAQIGEPATAAQQQQQQQQQTQQSPYTDIPSLADIGKDMASKS